MRAFLLETYFEKFGYAYSPILDSLKMNLLTRFIHDKSELYREWIGLEMQKGRKFINLSLRIVSKNNANRLLYDDDKSIHNRIHE